MSHDGGLGVHGSLCVVDSQNILASVEEEIWTWNGSIWQEFTNVSLGIVTTANAFPAIWGKGPNPTPVVTSATVERVIPIAKDLIKVEFSNAIAVNDQVLDPTNYQLSPGISAVEVLPIEDPTTTEVYLRISPKATFDTVYSLTIPSAGVVTPLASEDIPATAFYTAAQAPLQTMTGEWLHHKTKVDSLRGNMSQMYNTSVGSNMFHILAGIGISDEEIGGDF